VDAVEMVLPAVKPNNNHQFLETVCDTHQPRKCAAAISYSLSEFSLSRTHIPAKIRDTVTKFKKNVVKVQIPCIEDLCMN
jgi:hypothetical protein